MQLNPRVARGRVIAAGRMLAGLDQEQLAAEAGLTPSTVSKMSPFAQRLIGEGSELERERLFTEHSPEAHDVATPKPKLH